MHRRSRAVHVVVPLLIVALLAGCGSEENTSNGAGSMADQAGSSTPTPVTRPSTTTERPATGSSKPDAPPSTAHVPEQLDFTATTLDGGSFDGATLAGTPAVLWFWAPWCPVCAREAPLIAELADQYAGQVTFIGVAGLSGDADAMHRFVDDGGVDDITHLDDRDGAVYAHFGVTQQYDIGFVAADGTVDIQTGPLSEDEITAEVARLATG